MNIDGNLNDWTAAERIDRGSNAGYEIFAKSDGADFAFALKAPLAIGANTTFWLNTDRNTSTGHKIFGFAGGAEFNVNIAADGTVNLYTGDAGETLVASGLTAAWSADQTTLEFRVAKAALGNPQAITVLADVNNAEFLPGSYADPGFTVFNDMGIVADPGKRVGIVFSETTAKAFFSETAYSQLFINAQSQVMQAGLPFDILTEDDLTNLATLAKYDTIVFPQFRNVQASQVDAITNTLEQATKQFGIGLIAAGEFMTNAADGSALPGDSYARMKLLFDATRVTGGFPDNVTVTSSDANGLVFDNLAAGETIREYTGVGWNAFASVSGKGTTIATATVGGQSYAAAIATQTGGRNVIFSSEAIAADSNLLWQAVDYSVNGSGPSVGLQITRQSSIMASRNDMDQSQITAQVDPDGTAPGIYDKMLPIVEQWKNDYGFVGSYYINVGDNPANGETTNWAVSGAYYKSLIAMGNEIGTHTYTHPEDTNKLTAEQIAFEFGQSKAVIEQQMSALLGRTFTVDGAAVPGAPETLGTSQAILAAQGTYVTTSAPAPNLVTNGDFSAGSTGWTNSAGAVEVGSAATYGITTTGAGNVLEVDAARGGAVDSVSQTIATQAGQRYNFNFDIAQRGGTASASNTVQVLWNGAVIDTITPNSTALSAKSYTVTASGSSSTLAFRELSGSDSVGGIIDNVVVKAIPTSIAKAVGPLEYLSGGYAGVGAGYVGGSGFLTPGSDQVYIAPNVTFDFTLIGFQGKTAAQAEAAWAAEWAALTSKAETPVIVWPWHDYGPTRWDINGDGAESRYTTEMFTNFIARAYNAGAEFVTLDDLAQRTESLAKSTISSTVVGDTITATVGSNDSGRFALDVDGNGTKVIQNVEGWYAYDNDSVFLPANGGTFKITLGTAADDVTRITALPMRANLTTLNGDGRNLSFSVEGEGKVVVDLAAPGSDWIVVTGGTVSSQVGELMTIDVGAYGPHSVNIGYIANAAPVITSSAGATAASFTIAENTADVTTIAATDANSAQGDRFIYSLAAGDDSAQFAIDATTGKLSFRTAPDFEAPADANRDNVYAVTVVATDARGLTDTQALSIKVTDVAGVTRTGSILAVNTMNGSSERDSLTGGWLNDTLNGLAGNDTLSGGNGRDTLRGDAGNDILIGGDDGDYLYGGAGSDVFRYLVKGDSTGTGSDRDFIYDFVRGEDKIDLSGIDANRLVSGDQAFRLMGLGGTFTSAGQLRFNHTQINGAAFTIVEGTDDNGSGAEFSIAVQGHQTFTAEDFIF